VTALNPLGFHDVDVERLRSGRLRYRVSGRDGGVRVLLQEEVLHLRGPSRDGIMGVSALRLGAGAVALRVSQSETAANLSANGLRPSGVLSFPERLSPDQREQVRGSLPRFQGAAGAGHPLIMDGGVKWERMTFTPEDAEFLASTKAGNEDICRLFGVPPTVAGITDRATYSNTEQEGRALVQNCLGPLAKRVEAAMMRCLLTPDERRTLYIEHDLSGLLRGDVQARFEAYRIGREIGVYSPNDIRRWENEPPIENGDLYHQPANWAPLGSAAVPAGEGA
jgi:HK97 family phage portal protein